MPVTMLAVQFWGILCVHEPGGRGSLVDQDPAPGAVRRGGRLTVRIWHPPAR